MGLWLSWPSGVAVGWRLGLSLAMPMVGVFSFAAVCLAVPIDGFFGFAVIFLAMLNYKPAKTAAKVTDEVVLLAWLGCGGKTGHDGCR